jgi:uncharacterized phage protein (TIGR02218 family)
MTKEVSNAYEREELGHEKRPAELYHMWWNDTNWYYTSGDVSVQYDGHTYMPATIERGTVTFDTKLEVSSLEVTFGRVHDPIIKFIAQNPVEVIWIEVFRLFRDQAPVEVGVIFIGQIKKVGIKGLRGRANCVGFDFYLKQPVPIERYGPQCNWTLFDGRCTKDDTGFKTTTQVTVSFDKLTFTSSGFGTFGDSFFERGHLVWESNRRMITSHVGNIVVIRYAILDITDGQTVEAFAGCNGEIQTCRDKFDNVPFFGGHPYIPIDNPVTWD